MELAKNVLTLVAISAMLIEPIWCASISEQLDEEESLKALRNRVDPYQHETESNLEKTMNKRSSIQQLIDMQSNNYQLEAIKKLMEHILVGKRTFEADSMNSEMMTKVQKGPILKGHASFALYLSDDLNNQVVNNDMI